MINQTLGPWILTRIIALLLDDDDTLLLFILVLKGLYRSLPLCLFRTKNDFWVQVYFIASLHACKKHIEVILDKYF